MDLSMFTRTIQNFNDEQNSAKRVEKHQTKGRSLGGTKSGNWLKQEMYPRHCTRRIHIVRCLHLSQIGYSENLFLPPKRLKFTEFDSRTLCEIRLESRLRIGQGYHHKRKCQHVMLKQCRSKPFTTQYLHMGDPKYAQWLNQHQFNCFKFI